MKDKNSKDLKSFIAGMAVGSVLIGGGVYATAVSAGSVSFSNSASGINASNVQGALNTMYSSAKNIAETNDELKYFKYYNECHTTTIPGSLFTKGNQNIKGVFSCTDYSNIYYNLKGGSAASSAGTSFCNTVTNCCKNSSHCNSTSGTCYKKCYSGYDEYYKNCVG